MWMKSLCLLLLAGSLTAAELTVGKGGTHATIAEGIAALADGDTLTILPGKYYETIDFRKQLKNVTIRAKYPGSVLIHGDKPAPAFVPVPGFRFIYEAPWEENVMAVNERDTLKVYLPAATIRELEFNFGLWIKQDGKLYISTTDGQPPDQHDLTVSVLEGGGLRLHRPESVIVEGLVFTGFYAHFRTESWTGSNGLQLVSAKNCVLRNCTAFLNANGISLNYGENSVIDNCIAYANGSRANTEGGNIIGWNGVANKIRSCTSMFRFPAGQTETIGLRFYGTMKDCNIEKCVSVGEQGLNIKGRTENCWLLDSYSQRAITSKLSRNNLFPGVNGYNPQDRSPLSEIKKEDWPLHYADPDNHDFRPLSASVLNRLEDLKDGDFVYLEPGEYPEMKINANQVTIRTRGTGACAVIKGGSVNATGCRLENLLFEQPVVFTGDNLTLHSCTFKAKAVLSGNNIQVTHCQFDAQPDFSAATGFRHSNLGLTPEVTGLADLDDERSFDAFPLGPYRLIRSSKPPRLLCGPFIRSVTDTMVDIEWWTDDKGVSSELCWGTSEKCENRAGQPFTGGYWHSMSLAGLTPGTTYFFRISSRSPLREHHSAMELAVQNRLLKREFISTDPISFTTLGEKPAPRTLTVSEGSISPVLDQARPGDTVLIRGGVYTETLYVRSAGLTLRNMPGEKVFLDGRRIIQRGIVLENKPDTVIDGLFFKELSGTAGIVINGGERITIRRCFYDGRSREYTPVFVTANGVKQLTIDNCLVTRGFHGAYFWRCPGLVIKNCVWFNNQIDHFYIHNMPGEIATLNKNVFWDVIPVKLRNPLMSSLNIESLRESENCWCLRVPENYRNLIGYTRIEGDQVQAKVNYQQFLADAEQERTSLFLNPGFAAVPEIATFQMPEAVPQDLPALYKELDKQESELTKKAEAEEQQWNGKNYEPMDFSSFFATNPACVENKIGLIPELFENGVAQ